MRGRNAILALVLIFALIFAGCGSGNNYSPGDESSEMDTPSQPMVDNKTSGAGFDSSNGENVLEPTDSEMESENSAEGFVPGLEDKLIYTASMNIQSMEFDAATAALNKLIKEQGGFIENSSVSGGASHDRYGDVYQGDSRYAEYTIRVPKDKFNVFLEKSGEIGLVIEKSTSVENITTQFYDVKSRLDAYLVQQERLLEILKKAEKLEDILAVENQLTEVRYNIDTHTTVLRGYQTSVDYSTVHVYLNEVIKYTPPEDETFFSRLGRAFGGSFEEYAGWLGDFTINMVYALPFLLTFAVIIVLLIKPVKKQIRKMREFDAPKKLDNNPKKPGDK